MYSTIDGLNLRISKCGKCRSMNQNQKRVPGVGKTHPLLFFIGEAPGRHGADQTGIPFTQDRSGMLLRNLMASVGLSPQKNVYISNLVKCNPRDEHGRNRRPSIGEIENCRQYLLAEIRIVNARILVPLGILASSELLGFRRPMKEINGREFFNKHHQRIVPLYHPGYIIRGNYSLDRYHRDFIHLRKLAQD